MYRRSNRERAARAVCLRTTGHRVEGGGGGGWGLQAKYLLPYCCICNSLYFDMQHDYVLKKLNFYPGRRTQAFDRKSRLICFICI